MSMVFNGDNDSFANPRLGNIPSFRALVDREAHPHGLGRYALADVFLHGPSQRRDGSLEESADQLGIAMGIERVVKGLDKATAKDRAKSIRKSRDRRGPCETVPNRRSFNPKPYIFVADEVRCVNSRLC